MGEKKRCAALPDVTELSRGDWLSYSERRKLRVNRVTWRRAMFKRSALAWIMKLRERERERKREGETAKFLLIRVEAAVVKVSGHRS